jgi:hypothetical protein
MKRMLGLDDDKPNALPSGGRPLAPARVDQGYGIPSGTAGLESIDGQEEGARGKKLVPPLMALPNLLRRGTHGIAPSSHPGLRIAAATFGCLTTFNPGACGRGAVVQELVAVFESGSQLERGTRRGSYPLAYRKRGAEQRLGVG